VDGHDVVVLDGREGPGLALEAGPLLRGGRVLRLEHLDGHHAAEVVGRLVDHAEGVVSPSRSRTW
jgi:hypothetical protein